MFAQLIDRGWSAAHSESWLDLATTGCGAVILGVLAVLSVRALLRGRWYRAVGVLGDADRARLRDEIAAVERRSTGELAVVVLERSDAHPQAAWFVAVATAIGGGLCVELIGDFAHPAASLAVHAVFGAIGFALAAALPDLRSAFVTRARAHEMAAEQALQEFARLGVHRTTGRTGVLILVSLFERCVIVLGDDGIHAKVGDEHWVEVNRAILDGLRKRSLADGLSAGIRIAGETLAQHFPRSAPHENELPDHLIVRAR